MEKEQFIELEELLKSSDSEQVKKGLELSRELITGGEYSEDFVELLTSLFFTDVYDYPELRENVEEAACLIGSFGDQVVPALLKSIDSADAKAAYYFALSIGKIGYSAVQQVLQKLLTAQSNFTRALLIFSLGKIKDSRIKIIVPDIIIYLEDYDSEIRDSATRAMGKFFEVIKVNEIPKEEIILVYTRFRDLIKDPESKIRAKALHSLGKMLDFGFLSNENVEELEGIIIKILGKDKSAKWDTVFIVRKEAGILLPKINNYFKK